MDPEAVETVERVPHGGVDDPTVLDFSANTNPERPPGVVGVYDAALSVARRYPSDYCEFRTAAAETVGCEPRSVIPTPGGLAAIRLALSVTVRPGDRVLIPAPSFGEYAREVRLQGGDPRFLHHDELLDADPVDYAAVVVCTPNNPTGEAADPDRLRSFAARCRETDTTLLVDEAFLDFTSLSSMAGEPGVVVARSLTKMYGLPGLRVGFAAATGDLRERLDTARMAWSLGTPAAAVGAHCLEQTEFVEQTRKRVERERERMRAALSRQFDVYPSDAPYLLFDVGRREVSNVVDAARAEGIAVRDATTFRGLDSHVRVAVKRERENDRLLDALADV
ncbi:threonine-phosphate decarboxylase CobD [Haloprofundus sp. MHR1]|uniref:threonine-phosphate decarboxylase CobD n=1 Tax=Haloprofundus sp. MHR1 TaxID=2572921 RepID=UPI0010BF35C7|nr:threonine-phosphate decarboxylase CobD [Haloprofundus sp. MHR1]QCJ47385.1 threonine-phosphate decarboxylase [Haloprofundus sp. MHR1]